MVASGEDDGAHESSISKREQASDKSVFRFEDTVADAEKESRDVHSLTGPSRHHKWEIRDGEDAEEEASASSLAPTAVLPLAEVETLRVFLQPVRISKGAPCSSADSEAR